MTVQGDAGRLGRQQRLHADCQHPGQSEVRLLASPARHLLKVGLQEAHVQAMHSHTRLRPPQGCRGSSRTSAASGAFQAAQKLNLRRGITWMTKEGLRQPNYWGSLTQSATVRLGNFRGEEVFTPLKSLLPMVHPEDIVFGGWDISSMNLADAMQRAQVGLACTAGWIWS